MKAVKIRNLIYKSNKANKLFMWTPGHCNIKGYEESDLAARKLNNRNVNIVKHFSFHHLLTYLYSIHGYTEI